MSVILRSSKRFVSSKMRAVVVDQFGDESVLNVKEIANPEPGPSQILVSVKAAGINPVDTYIRSGNYLPSRLPKLPYTPGGDVCGVVEAVGADVNDFKVGDKVYSLLVTASGAYAEKATVEETFAVKLHQGLSFEEGSALGVPYFTAFRAIKTIGGAQKGEKLLVHGASGGVGLACLQIGKHLGLEVIGTAGSVNGAALVESQGVRCYRHDDPDYLQKMKEAEGGFDLIVEMLANKNLENDLTMLNTGSGRVMIVGCRGEITINPRLLMGPETQIRGIGLTAFWDFNEKDEAMLETIKCLDEMASQNLVKPILGKSYSLDDVQKSAC
ncbi:Oidioi.mRNA.OKI2018_I69.PAR.g11905.t1.cds [Oikopleura dioica]|uniref:Oidioi.mRNA.OKI2018_I69.PAR.g11905.t1.cds n=1 Tax=Oikopleura dioica TaxID=34765 RepID=A0ABN7S3I0_OIKDI|nr:Oidioi.mRNA.OKI2018_I69.PAR.g11905.t1.cds [Oikopleura dioica]